MAVSVLTQDDLNQFKVELISEIRALIPNIQQDKRYLRSPEVRKLLNDISPGKLQMMRDKGQIPFSRIGGTIFYDRIEIEKLLINESLTQ